MKREQGMDGGTAPACTVVVPARDEAARLPRLLTALAEQRDAPPFSLCLYLDGCTDDSRAVVDALAPALPFPVVLAAGEGGASNAGRARGAAGALALARQPGAALLFTDADSAPAPGWILANLRALDRAEVVAGRILLARPAEAPIQTRVARYLDRLHRQRRLLDPVDWEDAETHHWTSAASLAVRPDVYRALGGFRPLTRGEDADFADRAWRAGFRIRRDARACVQTSARRRGRVADGFAAGLASLDGPAPLPPVSHPADEAWRYRHHALARGAWARGDLAPLAAPLRLAPADLGRVAAEVANADAFAARVVGAPPGGMRQVSLAQAELALAAIADRWDDAA